MKLKYFELARKLSKLSEHHHQIGAVIVRKNRVLGVGFNKPRKTHTKSNNAYRTVHAELAAILAAQEDLTGTVVYVYREFKDGSPNLAKPCKYCQLLIKQAGIKRVFYTANRTFEEYEV
jgi:deoxycytidylate deaminase